MPALEPPHTDTELTDDQVEELFGEIITGDGHGKCTCSCRGCMMECPNRANKDDGLCGSCRPYFTSNGAVAEQGGHCHLQFAMGGGE